MEDIEVDRELWKNFVMTELLAVNETNYTVTTKQKILIVIALVIIQSMWVFEPSKRRGGSI